MSSDAQPASSPAGETPVVPPLPGSNAAGNPLSSTVGGDYGADKIQVLEGMEAVRKRPGMYIGDTASSGLYQLVWEAVDNSIDEALAGHCSDIHITIHGDGSMSVADNGRGIPVAPHPSSGKSTLEVVLTVLHAGGKFDNAGAGAYKKSGGLHGVGVSCVNAVSRWFVADVHRDGKHHRMRFEKGHAVTPLEIIADSSHRGTRVQWQPDPEVFGSNLTYAYATIATRLRELAFLNSGVRITFSDEREEGKSETFYNTDGLAGFVRYLNQGKEALHQVIHLTGSTPEGVEVEVALQYTDSFDEHLLCFANNIRNRDGGSHLEGFKTALTRELNGYAKANGMLKSDKVPGGEDLREGITAIISVKLMEPKFSNQTKDKLINGEIAGIVQSLFGEKLKSYCEENPKIVRNLILKACAAMDAREAARKARDLSRKNRKSMLSNAGMPDKLRDCTSRDVHETELYLVEGDSAGGSAKRGSDARYQAILPLKGKIINVEKARLDKVLGHSEISALIQASGVGIAEEFNLANLRYGKIIIMTDADVDGSHIRTLLLTFFFRQMPQLIEHGHIHVAAPPLYKVTRGKSSEYIYEEKLLNGEKIRLGLAEATLIERTGGTERTLAGEQLTRLVQVLSEFEEHERVLALKGLTLDEYLRLRTAPEAGGLLPLYHARIGEDARFLTDEAQLDALLGRGQPVVERQPDEPAAILPEIIEFTERGAIEASLQRLRESGFDPEFLIDSPGRVATFVFKDHKEEALLTHLHALVPAVRRFGERGLDIQRYKGLGEMNPDQLWETTMDPTRRTMYRVTMSDAIEAERMFATLMGNDVSIRRDFIERYALAVAKRLDV
jgi:DNA gyrase subunit B